MDESSSSLIASAGLGGTASSDDSVVGAVSSTKPESEAESSTLLLGKSAPAEWSYMSLGFFADSESGLDATDESTSVDLTGSVGAISSSSSLLAVPESESEAETSTLVLGKAE